MKTLQNYLYESLLQHIALEFKNEDIIYEKYGEYDGCKELTEYIVNKIKENNFKNIEINYNEVKDINNICFNKLYIILNESDKNIASYFIPTINDKSFLEKNKLNSNYKEYSVINEDINRFDNCIIIIETSSFRNTSLSSLLNHELTHLFNDFQIQLFGLHSFFELFNNESYKRTKEYNQHKHPLVASKLEHALYLLDEYEKNAFISQLCSEIRKIKDSDKYYYDGKLDANKIYHIVQSLDIYKAYMNIANFINDFDNNVLTKREQEDIVNEWESIYKEKLTLNQIFKKLKYKFENAKRKIESIIPKKIAEEFSEGEFRMDKNIDLINLYKDCI